jgi:hypothetical protein
MVKTIISPIAVLDTSNTFFYWTQIECKDLTAPGVLKFTSQDGSASMIFNLIFRDGLYYCMLDIYTVAQTLLTLEFNARLPQLPRTFGAPHQNSHQLQRLARMSLKYECQGLAHQANINSKFFRGMSPVPPRCLNTTRSIMLTSKNKRTSINR